MNETDYAWAAGFFDGEGNVHFHITRRNSLSRSYGTPRLTVAQVDYDSLKRFADIVGVGKIFLVDKKKYGAKSNIYHWVANGAENVDTVIELIGSYLCDTKWNQYVEMMERYAEQKATRPKRTHCPNGHKYNKGSYRLKITRGGYTSRICLRCEKATAERHNQKRRLAHA